MKQIISLLVAVLTALLGLASRGLSSVGRLGVASLGATLAPHPTTPQDTAPNAFDVLRGVWTALLSSGCLLTLLTQVEPLAQSIPHPVASAVVAGLVHLAIILVRQYAGGPVSR